MERKKLSMKLKQLKRRTKILSMQINSLRFLIENNTKLAEASLVVANMNALKKQLKKKRKEL